jgi:hypothetical protein
VDHPWATPAPRRSDGSTVTNTVGQRAQREIARRRQPVPRPPFPSSSERTPAQPRVKGGQTWGRAASFVKCVR